MDQRNRHSISMPRTAAQPGDGAPFDLMDRKILSALRANGRLTMAEIAQRVGLSTTPAGRG